jgi:hypothetical protein
MSCGGEQRLQVSNPGLSIGLDLARLKSSLEEQDLLHLSSAASRSSGNLSPYASA